MEGFAYFPTIIYRDEQPNFIEKLRPICSYYLQKEKKEVVNNQVMIQTENLVYDHELNFLKSYLLTSSVRILQDQGYNVNAYDFFVSSLWFQEIKKDAGTNIHVHRESQLSGWIFIDTPENGSYPVFYDPRMNKEMIELDINDSNKITNATSFIKFDNVKPGTVLFNNSWLRHQISQNNSNFPTIALHFMVSHEHRKV